MIRADADAWVRQLRGYIRVFRDPPGQRGSADETRLAMAKLFASEFTALDEFLTGGGELPEQWDPHMGNTPRVRHYVDRYRYVFPPGHDGPACAGKPHSRPCRWIYPKAKLSICERCHTIRIDSEME